MSSPAPLQGSLHFADRAPRPAGPGVATVATQPHYNLKDAPNYVPPPSASVRAGADDFLRCPSVGQRC